MTFDRFDWNQLLLMLVYSSALTLCNVITDEISTFLIKMCVFDWWNLPFKLNLCKQVWEVVILAHRDELFKEVSDQVIVRLAVCLESSVRHFSQYLLSFSNLVIKVDLSLLQIIDEALKRRLVAPIIEHDTLRLSHWHRRVLSITLDHDFTGWASAPHLTIAFSDQSRFEVWCDLIEHRLALLIGARPDLVPDLAYGLSRDHCEATLALHRHCIEVFFVSL